MRVDESPNLWETITERETSRVIGLIHNSRLLYAVIRQLEKI